MRRWIAAGLVVSAVVFACAGKRIPVVIAQTLPYPGTLAWDAIDPSYSVTSYKVYLDTVQVGTMTNVVCPMNVCTFPVSIATKGIHTLGVSGVNQFGEGTQGTLTINLTVPKQATGVSFK